MINFNIKHHVIFLNRLNKRQLLLLKNLKKHINKLIFQRERVNNFIKILNSF